MNYPINFFFEMLENILILNLIFGQQAFKCSRSHLIFPTGYLVKK